MRSQNAISRRSFLAAAAAGSVASAAPRGKGIPVGLELYSVRDELKQDLFGVVRAVAKMGYQGVEFAGYYGRKADELRKLLDENGLKCCGTHIGLDTLLGAILAAGVLYAIASGKAGFSLAAAVAHERLAARQVLVDPRPLRRDPDPALLDQPLEDFQLRRALPGLPVILHEYVIFKKETKLRMLERDSHRLADDSIAAA